MQANTAEELIRRHDTENTRAQSGLRPFGALLSLGARIRRLAGAVHQRRVGPAAAGAARGAGGQVGIVARRVGGCGRRRDDGRHHRLRPQSRAHPCRGTGLRRTASRPARPHRRRTGLGGPDCIRIPRVHAARSPGQHRVLRVRRSPVCVPTTRPAWTKACWPMSASRIRRSGWADRGDTARNTRSTPRSTSATSRWRPAGRGDAHRRAGGGSGRRAPVR